MIYGFDMLEYALQCCGAVPIKMILTIVLIISIIVILLFLLKRERSQILNCNSKSYLPALDGLKAVCAILIFAFHNWQQTWLNAQFSIMGINIDFTPFQRYGYIAIDAFFVMSGFGLFYPIARQMFGEIGRTTWKEFYIKRLKRIIPAYYFMLIMLLIFPVLSYNVYNADDMLYHFGMHAVFAHIYDADTLGSVISTAWTLGIEAAFYAIFPLIVFVFRKKPPLVFLLMFIFSQSLRILSIMYMKVDMKLMSNPLLYIDIFGAGMLGAYITVYIRNRFNITNIIKLIMTFAAAVCLFGVYVYIIWMGKANMSGYDAASYHRLFYRIIPAIMFSLFLIASEYGIELWRKFWGNRFFVFMSGISYSFYLWHQNIHIALRKLNLPYTDAVPPMNDKNAMIGFLIISILASVGIASFSTYCIEKPILKYVYRNNIKKN